LNAKRGETPFPTKEQVLEFVRDSDGPVGKREIARAFNIRGHDRARLNDILRDLRADGELDRGRGRRFGEPGSLPSVTVIDVISPLRTPGAGARHRRPDPCPAVAHRRRQLYRADDQTA
jgi:ribonuclease R